MYKFRYWINPITEPYSNTDPLTYISNYNSYQKITYINY